MLDKDIVKACQVRLGRLRESMSGEKLDAFLIANEPDIFYLTDFVGHDSLLLVTGDSAWIISDPRYDEFLDPWRPTGMVEVVMGVRHRLERSVAEICSQAKLTRLGVQAEHLSVARRARLAQSLPELTLVDTTGVIEGLRKTKDEVEIARIERAVAAQQGALQAALQQLGAGVTELEFSGLLDLEMKRRGAYKSSFDAIIGAGPHSSVIHYQTAAAEIGPGVLLVDWGAVCDGYCGDLTRTFSIGPMPGKIREIYTIVLEAQQAAIEAIAPGKVCADIDAVARKIITDAGYGEYFGHGLGHGLGIEVHEEPYFNDLAADELLQPGTVMTVEPGVYLPGVGGVRIEDDVLVTRGGHRVLSDYPKDLDSAVIEPAAVVG